MCTNFQYLGIYEDAINDAIDTCEAALKQIGGENDIDDMNEDALYHHEEIIAKAQGAVDTGAREFTLMGGVLKDADVDYYVNGDDSHLYIDSEEIYA